LELGQVRVVQKGEEGLAHRQLRQILEDGKLVREEVISEQVVQPPVSEIVAVGHQWARLAGEETPISTVGLLVLWATAYLPH